MLLRIGENISGRIRKSNEIAVIALEKQLTEYKMRVKLGAFLLNIVVMLCMFTFLLSWLTQQANLVATKEMISIPITIGFVLIFIYIMLDLKFPLAIFGFTTHNWRKAITESILFTLLMCILTVLLKVLLIKTTGEYAGHDIFEPHLFTKPGLNNEGIWWLVLSYPLIVVPLQELMVRGGLQSALNVFLTGRFVTLKSIFVSNLMFSTAHLLFGINIACLVFISGLYFGWLYSRQPTLIGVIIAHAILGLWGLAIVGFF